MIRIVGDFLVSSNVAGQAPDFAVGIIGTTQNVVPQADTAVDSPWLWWTGGATQSEAAVFERYHLDLKGKRTFLDPDDDVHLSLRNADPTDTLLYAFGIRILWMLP